jgi:hypothetical protein
LNFTPRPRAVLRGRKHFKDNGKDIAQSRVNGATGILAKQKHPAAPIGKLKYFAVKHGGALGELTIDALHTVNGAFIYIVFTLIKLNTTYQIIGVVKADRFLDYCSPICIWMIKHIILVKGNLGYTDCFLLTCRIFAARIIKGDGITNVTTKLIGFITVIVSTIVSIITRINAGLAKSADTALDTIAPDAIITVCITGTQKAHLPGQSQSG